MRFYFLYIFFFIPTLAFADGVTDTIRIGEVSVQSSKTKKQHVIVFDSVTIASAQHQNLTKFLQENSSVQFKVYGSSGSAVMSIRGANAAHSKIKWNGMDLGSPMLNQNDVSLLSVSNADEIVLNRGGSTATQGNGALAGYVTLKTNPSFNNQTISLSANYNSLDNKSLLINFKKGTKNFSSHTSFNVLNNQNNFTYINYSEAGSPTQNQLNSAWKKFAFIQSFYYRRDKTDYEFHSWYQESDRELSPAIFNRNRSSYQLDNSFRNIFSMNTKLNENNILKASITYTHEKIRYVSRITEPNTSLILLNTNSYFDQVQNNVSWAFKVAKFSQEFAYQYNFEGAYVEDYTNYKTRNRLALVSNTEKQFSDFLNVLFSNRIEQVNSDYIFASSIELTFNKWSNKGVTPYVRVSKNYNLPGLNDLNWVPGGNPNLKPEKSFEQELGLTYDKNYSKLTVSSEVKVYHSIVKDWILWQPSTTENGLWTPQNLMEVKLQGLEFDLSFNYTFNKNHKVGIKTFYAYSDALNQIGIVPNDKSVGKQLIYIPKEKWGVNFQYVFSKYQLLINQHCVSHRFITSDESSFLPSYILIDVDVQRSFTMNNHLFQTGLYIENITNKVYESLPFQAMPARVLGIKLNYSLTNNQQNKK